MIRGLHFISFNFLFLAMQLVGINSSLLQWKCGVLTTGPPGNSLEVFILNKPQRSSTPPQWACVDLAFTFWTSLMPETAFLLLISEEWGERWHSQKGELGKFWWCRCTSPTPFQGSLKVDSEKHRRPSKAYRLQSDLPPWTSHLILKGLDLIECLMNHGWRFMTLYRTQGSRPSPRKRNAKKQNGCLRRPYK